METQLKPPTQSDKISAADQKRVNDFKEFLKNNQATELRKVFLRIYFEFTQAITRNEVGISEDTSGDLFLLQCLIEIFD